MEKKVSSDVANAVLRLLADRDEFDQFLIEYDFLRPMVVAIRGVDFSLKAYMALWGEAGIANEDLLLRKAEVVRVTGKNCREAAERAREVDVDLKDWVPNGTYFQGAAPIKDGLEIIGYVAVSGQDHIRADQPIAERIAEDFFELAEQALVWKLVFCGEEAS